MNTWERFVPFSPNHEAIILNDASEQVRTDMADQSKLRMGVHYAFALGISGRGQIVGVLDEGIDPHHGDFSTVNKVEYIDVTDRILADADNMSREEGRPISRTWWRDGEERFDGTPRYHTLGTADHGVHVAGIIAAPGTSGQSMGVAPNARIVSGTMDFGSDIASRERDFSELADVHPVNVTLRAIIQRGARVINNSWGIRLKGLAGDASRQDVMQRINQYRWDLAQVLEAARGENVVMVFAAGNYNGDHANLQASAPLVVPELEPQWLSVVNLARNGYLHRSSNLCGETKAWCIAAPGSFVYAAGMTNNLTPEALAGLANAGEAFGNEAAFFSAVDEFREGLVYLRAQGNGADPGPAVARPLDELRRQNPDPRVLGESWARQLFHLALRYQNAPEIITDRGLNELRPEDDMEIFISAKKRFGSYETDAADGARHRSRLERLVNFAREYNWENSPLYHMEMAYTRMVTEATTREYGHEFKTGTSMAAPHVSGALALVMERFPYMTAAQARDTLLTTANDLTERDANNNLLYVGVDGKYGWGMVNVARAMHGPRAFLKDFNITLPADRRDIWENNIADGSEFLPGYGGGLSLAGGGVLILPGRNSYRGQTNVVDGALFIDGTLTNSRAVVSDSGIIGGRGTLLSLTVRSGGAVSPGNPFLDGEEGRFGKLTITNDLIFEPGSLYRVHSRVNAERKMVPVPEGHLNLPGTDLIEVNGSAILNGGTVDLQADQGNWNYRSSADILVAHGGIEGEFEGVSSNLGFLTPRLDHGTNNVTLKLERNDVTFASVGRTPNQVASGAGLDGVPAPRPRGDAPSNRRANAVPAAPRNSSGAPNARVAESPANNRVAASGATNPRAPLSTTAQVAPHAEIAGGSSRASSATASNFSSGGSATFAPETLAAVPAKEVAAASEAAPRATPIAALEQGQLYGALVDSSVDTVSASLDSFSGETHASLAAVAANDTVFVRDAMLRRMPHSTMALAAGSGRDGGNPVASGYVAWGQAIAGVTDRDASFGIGRVKTTSKGFVTGIDKSWDNRVNIGAAFSMLDTDANVFRPGSNNNSVASRHIGAYAGAEVGVARVRAGGSWGWYNIRSGRSASVNAFGDSLSAKYKGRALQAFGEVGLGFETGSLSLEPFVNVTHVNFLGKDIAEKGGAASLSGRSKQKVTMSTIGVRSAVKIADGADGRSGFAKLNIGWRHNLDNAESGATANLSFAGAPKSFTVIGAAPGKDLAIVDLALDTPVTENLDIGVSYGGQFSDKFTAQALKATLQLRF